MSDTSVLPEGVSAEAFSSAVGELRNIVGDNWVFSDEAGRRIYRDPFSPLPDEQFMPSAAVSPASVEEIEKMIKGHQQEIETLSLLLEKKKERLKLAENFFKKN